MDFFSMIMASAVFLVLIVAYFLYLTRPGGKKGNRYSSVNLSIVPGKWVEIQSMISQGGPANFRQAIMEGDKLVDMVLRSKVSGETMGERLKNAKHLFSRETYGKLWTAHKIRNKLAHEADFEGLSSEAVLAVRNFEKALKELRVI